MVYFAFFKSYIKIAKEDYNNQLIHDKETPFTEVGERRTTLRERCAAMAEVLAKEEAERLLWKKMFCVAAHRVYGNKKFY